MENYIVNINDFPKRGSFIKWKECVGIDVDIVYKNHLYTVRKNSYLCSIKEEEIEFFTHQEICEYYNISRSIVHNIIKKSKEYKPYSKQHYDRYKHIIGLKIIAKY